MVINTEYKNNPTNQRLADLYNINLDLYYGTEADFQHLINQKVDVNHKASAQKRAEDDALTFWEAIIKAKTNVGKYI